MTTLTITSGFPPVPATRTLNLLDSRHACGRGLHAIFGPCSHTGARVGLAGDGARAGGPQLLQTFSLRAEENQALGALAHTSLLPPPPQGAAEGGENQSRPPGCPIPAHTRGKLGPCSVRAAAHASSLIPSSTCIFPSDPAAPTPGLLPHRSHPPGPPPSASQV